MREQEIETLSCKLAETLGWIPFKGFSRNGGADRIFIKNGYCFFVEFKTQKGKLRKNQEREQELAKLNGTKYYVVRSFEEFVEILKEESQDG